MNEFKNYHPAVNFIYFFLVIGFSVFFMHPVCLVISLLSGTVFMGMINGIEVLKKKLPKMLVIIILMAAVNPLFSHAGVSILCYFPNGNPLTLESIVYGFAASVMIMSVIIWFSCYNEVMTSDKFIYLFGKIIPSMSLILSMTLRFVPRFLHQFRIVSAAQKCLGLDYSGKNIFRLIKSKARITGIMITWALENSIETADSMKARGYGLTGRSAFSIFNFDKRDLRAVIFIFICGVYVLTGKLTGALDFRYFPFISGDDASFYDITCFAAYMFLCIYPVIIELKEGRRWKKLKSGA